MVSSARFLLSAIVLSVAFASVGSAQQTPPVSWVDKDTGHRIHRLTDEPGSSGFYFNVNAYSPDGKLMAYDAPEGIRVLDLTTMKTRLLVPNPPRPAGVVPGTPGWYRSGIRAIVAGRKTNSVFFTKFDPDTKLGTVYKADMYSGAVTKLATLPPRASVATINADETLGAGTYDESEASQQQEYGRNRPQPATPAATPGGKPAPPQAGSLLQPEDKGEMMERRLAARIPVVLYTINLQTGEVKVLFHSTDWIGHMLFSPVDPTLLMYCHEGPWQGGSHPADSHGWHRQYPDPQTHDDLEIAGHGFGDSMERPSGTTGSTRRGRCSFLQATTWKPISARRITWSATNGRSTST